MEPPLDDGVMATYEERATWNCMNCHNEREFSRHEPYTEIRIWDASESLFLRKARHLDYDEFVEWTETRAQQPEEAE